MYGFDDITRLFKRLALGASEGKEPSVVPSGFEISGKPLSNRKFNQALDRFFAKINFETEDDTILPQSVEITKQAFEELFEDMGWVLAGQSFIELLEEKSGKNAFRADGITPNWYHEFREILPFLSMARDGILKRKDLERHGGLETLVCGILRHDSWEDFGKTKHQIYASLERVLHESNLQKLLDQKTEFYLRHKATTVAEIVDLVTRKTPRIIDGSKEDDDLSQFGQIATKSDGKIIKADRFRGDLNEYYQRHLGNILAVLAKYSDSIEGVSTRIIDGKFNQEKGRFSVDDNMKYARERRGMYGRRATDLEATKKYPEFAETIRSLDDMLGLTLVVQETINDYYAPGSRLNAEKAFAMRVDQYVERVAENFSHIPAGFRADMIQLGRLEKIAQKDRHMQSILEKAIYPAIIPITRGRVKRTANDSENAGDNPALIQ